MVTSYIIVLSISAWLIACILIYVAKRFGKLFGNPQLISAGFIMLLPLIGFLAVVAAPPPMLVGCMLLVGAHLTRRDGYIPPVAQHGVPLVAAILAACTIAMPSIHNLPALALYVLSIGLLYGMAVTADYLSSAIQPASSSMLVCLLPLLAAPFLGAPSFIAIDIMLISSVLLGVLIMATPGASLGLARQPFALILGWLIVEAASDGAWIAAALSLVLYGAAVAFTLSKHPKELQPYAS